MDKLQKLEQIIGLVESDKITHDEFAQVFEAFLNVVKEIKESLETKIDKNINNTSDVSTTIKEVAYSLSELELKAKDLINGSERSSLVKIKELSQRLSSEVNRIEASMPEVKDFTADISYLEDLIKKIPAPIPQVFETGESLIEKINDLPTDDSDYQIDASHIKNLPKVGERIIERVGGGASMVRVLNNGQVIGDTVTEINFTNATTITYTGGATGRRANITTGGGGTGYTKETPSGSLYDQVLDTGGITFTVTATPVYVVADGATYFDGAGYSIAGLTLTMTNPVTQFIRSFY